MKLSDIFRKAVFGGNSLPESQTDAPQRENSADLPAFVDAPEKLSGEDSAQKELEIVRPKTPSLPLPEGYFYPDSAKAAHLHAELLRELPANHPLFGVPLETFAACEANDDTLFRFRGNPGRFVLVHLTWLGRTEIDKDHPSIVLDGTFADFFAHGAEVSRIISEH